MVGDRRVARSSLSDMPKSLQKLTWSDISVFSVSWSRRANQPMSSSVSALATASAMTREKFDQVQVVLLHIPLELLQRQRALPQLDYEGVLMFLLPDLRSTVAEYVAKSGHSHLLLFLMNPGLYLPAKV